jgi:hypothetical protein
MRREEKKSKAIEIMMLISTCVRAPLRCDDCMHHCAISDVEVRAGARSGLGRGGAA